ncbi:MAG: hypothetical protein LAT83_08640 [Kiritimatiellae bacterium]|nr:hypothetical protein [Kiritimatiellia bacterium]
MKFSPVSVPLLLAFWMAGAACYRSDLREWEVAIPDAETLEALEMLAGHLRAYNQRLTEEARTFESVETRMDPPRLLIRYNARMIARKNIAHLLADVGYGADGVPGDPERREAFRRQAADAD